MKIKKTVAILLTAALLVPFGSIAPSTASVYGGENTLSIETRAEVTEWKTRVVDGRIQKRLWSVTYAKWLTNWQWA